MQLSDFHSLVSTSLKRGTTLDNLIPTRAKLSVQWMERNYTFKYMERFRLLQIVQGNRTIEMPANVYVKSMKFIRLIKTDNTFVYLNKIEPEDMQALRSADPSAPDVMPQGYFLVGNNTLVLDAVPSANLNGEGMLHEYSAWPSNADARHPLLDMGADLLLAQTLLYMAVFDLKDPRMVAEYKAVRDEAVNTMTRAADEERYGGESISMAFSP